LFKLNACILCRREKKTLSSATSPSRLGSHVAYTGAGRSSMFAKRASLQRVANGFGDITSFFAKSAKKVHVEIPGPMRAATVHQHDVSEWSESSDDSNIRLQ
jgi:hypothetical protein